MTQTVVLGKLKKFLEIIEPELIDYTADEFSDPDKVNELLKYQKMLIDSFDRGYCFSFSLIHGGMESIDKLEWWENALVTIANWDGEENTLEQFVTLPQAEKEEQTGDDKKIKLKTLIERVFAYVSSQQLDTGDEGFVLKNQNQVTMLSASQPYFEILDSNHNVKQIKDSKSIAGYFSEDELMKLFDEKTFTDVIALVNGVSSVHSTRVSFKNGKWMIYDPNYEHTSLKTIHKTFDNKSELVKEILHIHSRSLTIHVATFNPAIKINFNLPDVPQSGNIFERLDGLGLYAIALYTPEKIADILVNIEQNPNIFDGVDRLGWALSKQDPKGNTALQHLAQSVPESLSKIFAYLAKDPIGFEHIANALAAQGSDGWTGLETLAQSAPHLLQTALQYAAQAPNGIQLLIQTFNTRNKNTQRTTLEAILEKAPELHSNILSIQKEYRKLMLDELITKNADSETGLQSLLKNNPSQIIFKLNNLEKSEETFAALSAALIEKNNQNESTLETLFKELSDLSREVVTRYAPQLLSKLLDLQFFDAIQQKNLEDTKTFLHEGVNPNSRNKEGDTALLIAIDSGDLTLVELLLKSGADCNLAGDNSETPVMRAANKGHLSILKLLLDNKADPTIRNNNGETALSLVKKMGRQELIDILESAAPPLTNLRYTAGSTFFGKEKSSEKENILIEDNLRDDKKLSGR